MAKIVHLIHTIVVSKEANTLIGSFQLILPEIANSIVTNRHNISIFSLINYVHNQSNYYIQFNKSGQYYNTI